MAHRRHPERPGRSVPALPSGSAAPLSVLLWLVSTLILVARYIFRFGDHYGRARTARVPRGTRSVHGAPGDRPRTPVRTTGVRQDGIPRRGVRTEGPTAVRDGARSAHGRTEHSDGAHGRTAL